MAYYRHSAEDKQENSVPIQRERVWKFAKENEIDIVHEEADQGKSGLSAERPAFQKLLREWILNPKVEFEFVLVLDVSRFGRFQNQNEAAHYEYLCDRAHKPVWYVEHGPVKDRRQPMDHLLTSIQRINAADYSRQLSEKVWYGSARVSREGFSAGGEAPYGLGRLLLDERRQPVRMLKRGEHKQISNERVVFRPLNDETTETVLRIFHWYVDGLLSHTDIASTLNTLRIPAARGGPWQGSRVLSILRNEAYIGTRLYNKTWGRLKERKHSNPRSEWIICLQAFPAIINTETFTSAQRRLRWLIPMERMKGKSLIRRAEREIIGEFVELLSRETRLVGKTPAPIVFPMVFSLQDNRTGQPQWYFTISESRRAFEYVIGIGLDMDRNHPVQRIFRFPTSDFGPFNVLNFAEDSSSYSRYIVPKDRIEETFRSIASSRIK